MLQKGNEESYFCVSSLDHGKSATTKTIPRINIINTETVVMEQ